MKITADKSIAIDIVRKNMKDVEDRAQRECFGTTWVITKTKRKFKKRSTIIKHCEGPDKLIDADSEYKSINAKLWEMKNI